MASEAAVAASWSAAGDCSTVAFCGVRSSSCSVPEHWRRVCDVRNNSCSVALAAVAAHGKQKIRRSAEATFKGLERGQIQTRSGGQAALQERPVASEAAVAASWSCMRLQERPAASEATVAAPWSVTRDSVASDAEVAASWSVVKAWNGAK